MANICYTQYALTAGDESQLQDLHDRMKRLQDMKEPLINNGYGNTWLGCLVEDLGATYEEVDCRGSWDSLTYGNGILTFSTETAWSRSQDVEKLLREKYDTITIDFISEEPGNGVFEKRGSHFPEEYMIRTDGFTDEYYTEQEAVEMFSDYFDLDLDDMEQCRQFVDEHNSRNEHDEDAKIIIHQFSIV